MWGWRYIGHRIMEHLMGYLADNWGSLASVTGVVVSLAGLAWAIIEARGARSASLAARAAANETRSDIARHLQAVDLQRAIALIQRIKILHGARRWDAALEQYQSLREMLSHIIARCPESQAGIRDRLTDARTAVTDIENLVGGRIGQDIEDSDRSRLNRILNRIQSDLEELASDTGFGNPQEDMK